MGITGTEVTKEAATMILTDDNYATIVSAVEQGRATFDNIRKFLRYLLSSNMGEVATVFGGVVLAALLGLTTGEGGVVLPLLATQILWINLITDSGPALAMGVDPTDESVMNRPPRNMPDRIINKAMWWRVIYIGVIMGLVTLLSIDMFYPGGLIAGSDSLDTARTVGFTTLVLAQLFNALNSRSETQSAFHHMTSNRWLWYAIGLGVGTANHGGTRAIPPNSIRHHGTRPTPLGGRHRHGIHCAVGGRTIEAGAPPTSQTGRRHRPGRGVAKRIKS